MLVTVLFFFLFLPHEEAEKYPFGAAFSHYSWQFHRMPCSSCAGSCGASLGSTGRKDSAA